MATTSYRRGMVGPLRILAHVCAAALIAAGAVACSGSEDGGDAGATCPAGTTERSAINELAGGGSETREEAIRAELENIGLEASDDAVASGVVAAGPDDDAGTEEVRIESESGIVVTMTLVPLDPGWGIERSVWCDRSGS